MIRKREIAKRVFAHEFNQSDFKIEEDGDRSPSYILTPTGAKCNRVYAVGVLLDKEEVRPDSNFWRMRVSDPTGVFVCTAGRYQPEALEVLLETEPPEMIAVVGKVNVYEGESRSFVSLRAESISVVDSEVRDYWVYETAKRTFERIKKMEKKEGEEVNQAWNYYNPNLEEYTEMVKKALKVIKDEFEAFKVTDDMEKEEAGVEEADVSTKEEDFDLEEEFEFEEEEWSLSDILEE